MNDKLEVALLQAEKNARQVVSGLNEFLSSTSGAVKEITSLSVDYMTLMHQNAMNTNSCIEQSIAETDQFLMSCERLDQLCGNLDQFELQLATTKKLLTGIEQYVEKNISPKLKKQEK